MQADCIIRNGTIVDPATGRNGKGDVTIKNGRIVPVAEGETVEAALDFDAAGLFVLPGLIDFHAHFFHGGTDLGVPVDAAMLPSGITTAVDGGSAGFSNYPLFRFSLMQNLVRTFAFLNICPTGQGTVKFHESLDPKNLDRDRIAEVMANSGGHLLGLKLRQSKELVGGLGLKPLEATLAVASDLGCPVVVHTTNLPEEAPALLDMLRPGDVYCHVFQGTGLSILDASGALHKAVYKARERGVIFDAANGSNHFVFAVAEAALREGFFPDIISSDLTFKTLYRGVVQGLPFVMSKYLALGMSLYDIARTVTEAPAKYLGLNGVTGTLAPGAVADVALFAMEDREATFSDTKGATRKGAQLLVPMATFRAGRLVYRNYSYQ